MSISEVTSVPFVYDTGEVSKIVVSVINYKNMVSVAKTNDCAVMLKSPFSEEQSVTIQPDQWEMLKAVIDGTFKQIKKGAFDE